MLVRSENLFLYYLKTTYRKNIYMDCTMNCLENMGHKLGEVLADVKNENFLVFSGFFLNCLMLKNSEV